MNYDTALATLKKANIKYYTYDTPNKVPVKIVLSGYAAVTIPQLLDDLARYKLNPRETKVLSRKRRQQVSMFSTCCISIGGP